MKCEDCNIEMEIAWIKNRELMMSKLFGVKDVPFGSVTVYECSKCQGESITITKIGELHREIFDHIINKKTPMLGEELKFARKYVKMSKDTLAWDLGVSIAHISQRENKHKDRPISKDLDKRTRILMMGINND